MIIRRRNLLHACTHSLLAAINVQQIKYKHFMRGQTDILSRLDVWQAVITGPVVVWLPSSGRDSCLRFCDHVDPADIGSARHVTPSAYASVIT